MPTVRIEPVTVKFPINHPNHYIWNDLTEHLAYSQLFGPLIFLDDRGNDKMTLAQSILGIRVRDLKYDMTVYVV